MTATNVLKLLVIILLILCLILFLVIHNLKKRLASTIDDLSPYEVGSLEHIGKQNRIFVSFNAKLYPENSRNSCYTVYECLDAFFKNPAKLMNSFYKGNRFGISLPISKVEGSYLFVQDLKGNQYYLIMKESPSEIRLSLSNNDNDE